MCRSNSIYRGGRRRARGPCNGAAALVVSKGDGIIRSVDGGGTWTRVFERAPTGRVVSVLKGAGYSVIREGLLVSKDNLL